jgi:branched-chain amino acid aminotransferase
MKKIVWFNGKISPLEGAMVPAADHSHLYGDGLFEGIRIYGHKVFKLDEHLERLYHGIQYLGYKMSINKPELKQIILDTCKESDADSGYIRLNVTRGTGLGLDPKNIDAEPNVMVMINTISLYPDSAYETGLDVVTTSFKVIPSDSLDPRLKCIGRYASNILAKQEANRKGAGEGLMLNHQGHIAECTGDNIFLITGKHITTPDCSSGILRGVTRDTVMQLAKDAGYTVEETKLTPFDLYSCHEAFLTGTAAEVIPMVTIDAQNIGDGKPGKITKHLMELYKAETVKGTAF